MRRIGGSHAKIVKWYFINNACVHTIVTKSTPTYFNTYLHHQIVVNSM